MVVRKKQINGSIRQTCLLIAKKRFTNTKNVPYVCMLLQKNNNIKPEILPRNDKVNKTHLLMMKTVTETEEDIVITSEDGTMEDLTMASREAVSFAESIQLPRPPPFPNVSVNDGSDPIKQTEAIHELLSILFQDNDGFMYRWQCDDLLLPALASTLSASEMRDYISPAITHIRSNALLIFGVRFGFTENPIKWQLSDATKKL